MRKEKAITLVSLVVTIIVLVIIAGVSINLVLGENGIVEKARRASENTKIAELYEKLLLEKGELATNNEGKVTLEKYLQHIANKGIIVTEENEVKPDGSVNIIVDNYVFLVEQITNNDIKIEYKGISTGKDILEPSDAIITFTGSIEQATLPINISAEIGHIDNESGVDIENCKWVYNTRSIEIGKDESLYTSNFTTNPETIELSINSEGEYYLHVLTVDNTGNKKETIKGPINIVANYHTHTGDGTLKGGCYTVANMHSHVNSCYKTCGGKLSPVASIKQEDGQTWGIRICYKCKAWYNYDTPDSVRCSVRTVICGKTTSTIDSYSLGCNKTDTTIENYKVQY